MLYLDSTPSPFLCFCLLLPHHCVVSDLVLLAAGITTSLFLQDSKFSFSQEDNWISVKILLKHLCIGPKAQRIQVLVSFLVLSQVVLEEIELGVEGFQLLFAIPRL